MTLISPLCPYIHIPCRLPIFILFLHPSSSQLYGPETKAGCFSIDCFLQLSYANQLVPCSVFYAVHSILDSVEVFYIVEPLKRLSQSACETRGNISEFPIIIIEQMTRKEVKVFLVM